MAGVIGLDVVRTVASRVFVSKSKFVETDLVRSLETVENDCSGFVTDSAGVVVTIALLSVIGKVFPAKSKLVANEPDEADVLFVANILSYGQCVL